MELKTSNTINQMINLVFCRTEINPILNQKGDYLLLVFLTQEGQNMLTMVSQKMEQEVDLFKSRFR